MKPIDAPLADGDSGLRRRLHLFYLAYTLCFVVFIGVMMGLERMGLPRAAIGFVFLSAPLVIYAVVGVLSRTTDADEYYVAGRHALHDRL